MSKEKENGKGTLVRTPRDLKASGVFARVAAADKKSGVADRVRHTAEENAKEQ